MNTAEKLYLEDFGTELYKVITNQGSDRFYILDVENNRISKEYNLNRLVGRMTFDYFQKTMGVGDMSFNMVCSMVKFL